MDGYLLSRRRRDLLAALGVRDVCAVEVLSEHRLSHVERLHLPGQRTTIYKTALRPFTGEAATLKALQAQDVPVPSVRENTMVDGMLGMLLHDLGVTTREPTLGDVAHAAVQIHRAALPIKAQSLDEALLAARPAQALALFDQIRDSGRYPKSHQLRVLLSDIAKIADIRADGAELKPFGLLHGGFRPGTVHFAENGAWHVLDFSRSLTGPGLLDLAAWSGPGQAPNPSATRKLITLYVKKGGHPDALADRGGLPAEAWALGWLHVLAAHRLLALAATGTHDPDADIRQAAVLERHLARACVLLHHG